MGHWLSAKHTKTCGKLTFFMVWYCSRACFGKLFRDFSLLGGLWSTSGRALAPLRRFGLAWGPLWRFWVATWRPKAQSLRVRAKSLPVTPFWTPKALCREPEVDGHGPNAIGHCLSVKYTKPSENLDFSWFGFGVLFGGFGVLFGGFG